MARQKVKLAYITNDSARKATFKKRKKGLFKKVSELSTLCGIDACAIIYSPYESHPEVWPNHLGAQQVIAQFKATPEMEQTKKMVNQETYTRQRVAKVGDLFTKEQKQNREVETTELMYECLAGKELQCLMMQDLGGLDWILDRKLKEIHMASNTLKKAALDQQVAPRPPLPPPPPTHQTLTREGMQGVSSENLVLELGLEPGQNPSSSSHEFVKGMNNPNEFMGFGHGQSGLGQAGEMMMPFNNDQNNPNFPGIFFP